MSFRWKTNPVNEIRTNPGYTEFNPMQPQPIQLQPVGMRGNEPWRTQYDMPQTQRAAYMDEYEAPAPQPMQDGVQAEIASLQTELASIERQIQEIDAQYPQLKNGGQEWEIAAKRAEIGDMSAYDSMMSRNASANGAVSGIENELYNAHKLLYGLAASNDYEQGAYANQIETALRRAEEWSARNPNAKMPPIYADLKAKYDEWQAKKEKGNPADTPAATGSFSVDNSDKTVNMLQSMVKDGTYNRKTEKEAYDWVKANPNSPYAKPLREWLDANKYKTIEAKKEWDTKKAQAEVAVRNWNRNRDIADKKNEWNRLVKNKAPVTLFYKLDEYGNPVPKGGV